MLRHVYISWPVRRQVYCYLPSFETSPLTGQHTHPLFVCYTKLWVQPDLEPGTICRRTSDSWASHTAGSDCRWRRFYLVNGTKAQCEHPPPLLRFGNSLTYSLCASWSYSAVQWVRVGPADHDSNAKSREPHFHSEKYWDRVTKKQ